MLILSTVRRKQAKKCVIIIIIIIIITVYLSTIVLYRSTIREWEIQLCGYHFNHGSFYTFYTVYTSKCAVLAYFITKLLLEILAICCNGTLWNFVRKKLNDSIFLTIFHLTSPDMTAAPTWSKSHPIFVFTNPSLFPSSMVKSFMVSSSLNNGCRACRCWVRVMLPWQ